MNNRNVFVYSLTKRSPKLCPIVWIPLHCVLITKNWTHYQLIMKDPEGLLLHDWEMTLRLCVISQHFLDMFHISGVEWPEKLSSACVKMIGWPLWYCSNCSNTKLHACVLLLLLVATKKKQNLSMRLVGPLLEQCSIAAFCFLYAVSELKPKLTVKLLYV